MAANSSTALATTQSNDPAYRVPPHNIEAEQALLGAILVNNDAFDRVSDFLKPQDFAEELHRRIFDIASQLIRAGKLATPITLKTFLGEHDLGGVSIAQYLARLAAEATTIINAADYGRTVHDLAVRRDLIIIGEDIVNSAFDAPINAAPRDHIEEAERKLYAIAEQGRYDGGFQRFSDTLAIAVDMAAKAWERDGKLSGLGTGFYELDNKLGGLQASDLVIIAGRPGMGKTAFATTSASISPKPISSPRGRTGRTKRPMAASSVSSRSKCRPSNWRHVSLPNNRPCPRTRSAAATSLNQSFTASRRPARDMQSVPFYIDQTGGISIAQLTARARRLKRQRGLDLLIVEYLNCCRARKSRSGQPRSGIDRYHHDPQGARQGLNVPIVALSQLSRQVESRDDKRRNFPIYVNPAQSSRTLTW